MRIWSKRKRARLLARAKLLDRWAARLRRQVREHTPKRRILDKPRLVDAA